MIKKRCEPGGRKNERYQRQHRRHSQAKRWFKEIQRTAGEKNKLKITYSQVKIRRTQQTKRRNPRSQRWTVKLRKNASEGKQKKQRNSKHDWEITTK